MQRPRTCSFACSIIYKPVTTCEPTQPLKFISEKAAVLPQNYKK